VSYKLKNDHIVFMDHLWRAFGKMEKEGVTKTEHFVIEEGEKHLEVRTLITIFLFVTILFWWSWFWAAFSNEQLVRILQYITYELISRYKVYQLSRWYQRVEQFARWQHSKRWHWLWCYRSIFRNKTIKSGRFYHKSWGKRWDLKH
jgi:hypothetical protein